MWGEREWEGGGNCVRVCMCASVHVCECACVQVCKCASVHVCKCASVRVCMCKLEARKDKVKVESDER